MKKYTSRQLVAAIAMPAVLCLSGSALAIQIDPDGAGGDAIINVDGLDWLPGTILALNNNPLQLNVPFRTLTQGQLGNFTQGGGNVGGTGLGSASSDAAAAIMGLNRFADFRLTDNILHEIAASLGSDINFFLGGPLAYCTGRGEKIHPIDARFDFTALLLTPDISVSTKKVYENYTHSSQEYYRLAEKINPLLTEKGVDSIAKICANMLEPSCFQLENRLLTLKQHCERLCDSRVCLSGSGSAMYMLVSAPDEHLLQLQETLKIDFDCESRFVNNNRW